MARVMGALVVWLGRDLGVLGTGLLIFVGLDSRDGPGVANAGGDGADGVKGAGEVGVLVDCARTVSRREAPPRPRPLPLPRPLTGVPLVAGLSGLAGEVGAASFLAAAAANASAFSFAAFAILKSAASFASLAALASCALRISSAALDRLLSSSSAMRFRSTSALRSASCCDL